VFGCVINRIKDEAEKKAAIAKWFADTWPTWGAKLTSVLASNNEGKAWFVGTKISLADVAVFNQLSYQLEFDAGCLTAFPLLAGLVERVKANAGIAAWLAKRPATW
jgi:glutathione S-transferase